MSRFSWTVVPVALTVVMLGGYRSVHLPAWQLAGYEFRLQDAATLLAVGACLIRISQGPRPVLPTSFWILVGLVSSGILLAAATLGVGPSVGYYREWVLGLSLFALAQVMEGRERARSLSAIFWVGLAAAVLQTLAFARYGIGGASGELVVEGEILNARPFNDHVGLMMLVALVLCLTAPVASRISRVFGGGALAISVLLAQHRSVWIGALTCGLVGLAEILRRRPSNWTVTGLHVGVVAGVFALVQLQRLPWFKDSATATGTFLWRLDQWGFKATYPRAPIEWLLGAGSGPTPLTDGSLERIFYTGSAHSLVVDLLTDVGILGLLCVAMIGFTSLGTHVLGLRLSVVAILGYSFTYPWASWVWLVVGLAFATKDEYRAVDWPRGSARTMVEESRRSDPEPKTPSDTVCVGGSGVAHAMR